MSQYRSESNPTRRSTPFGLILKLENEFKASLKQIGSTASISFVYSTNIHRHIDQLLTKTFRLHPLVQTRNELRKLQHQRANTRIQIHNGARTFILGLVKKYNLPHHTHEIILTNLFAQSDHSLEQFKTVSDLFSREEQYILKNFQSKFNQVDLDVVNHALHQAQENYDTTFYQKHEHGEVRLNWSAIRQAFWDKIKREHPLNLTKQDHIWMDHLVDPSTSLDEIKQQLIQYTGTHQNTNQLIDMINYFESIIDLPFKKMMIQKQIEDDPTGETLIDLLIGINDIALKKHLISAIHDKQQAIQGASALHLAAFNGLNELVNQILTHQLLDIDQADRDGNTAIHYAAYQGHTLIAHSLINHGIDVNHADADGCTALMIAAHQGHTQMVNMLLSVPGILTDLQDDNGLTAYQYACSKEHNEVSQLLEDHVTKTNRLSK